MDRDGTKTGFDLEFTRAIRIPVIAFGGVTDETDIKRLCESDKEGMTELRHAQALADEANPSWIRPLFWIPAFSQAGAGPMRCSL